MFFFLIKVTLGYDISLPSVWDSLCFIEFLDLWETNLDPANDFTYGNEIYSETFDFCSEKFFPLRNFLLSLNNFISLPSHVTICWGPFHPCHPCNLNILNFEDCQDLVSILLLSFSFSSDELELSSSGVWSLIIWEGLNGLDIAFPYILNIQ